RVSCCVCCMIRIAQLARLVKSDVTTRRYRRAPSRNLLCHSGHLLIGHKASLLMLHEALSRLEIRPSADRFEWAWVLGENDLDRMLWPIVRSAAELLTSGDLRKVRQCAREGCDWLFVDASKNHSRRWCSMNMCGSRVKARRYYQRKTRVKG
ncbi:MAG: CGNR zinc finger domain-containing protein, partial [Anaerolineae bacterium]|nr:CGNR zinc finger domain-containing protein [Anaerolineae bacterium]